MIGRKVTRIRSALGINSFALAEALGVSVSTLYRWEASKESSVIDSPQRELLAALQAVILSRHKRQAPRVGQDVVAALRERGMLGGFYELLKFALSYRRSR